MNTPGYGGSGKQNPYGTTFGTTSGGGGYTRAPSDSYGAPQGPVQSNQVQDGYGAPQGPVQSNQVQDGYGAPQGPVVQGRPAAPVQDGYGAPQAPIIGQPSSNVQDGYGAPQGPVVQQQTSSTVQDGYGAPRGPVIQAGQSATAPVQQNQDSYGAPQGAPIGPPRQNNAAVTVSQAMAPQAISNNVIKMLPAPNLATGRPNVVQQSGTSQVVQGSFGVQPASSSQSAQDSYGIPQGGVITGRGNINDIVSSVSGGGGGATPNSGPSPGSVVQLANISPTIIGSAGGSAQGGTTEFGKEMQLKGRRIKSRL